MSARQPAVAFVPVAVPVEVAGELVGCGRTAAWAYVRDGVWRVIKHGRRTAVLYGDLVRWAEEHADVWGVDQACDGDQEAAA